MSEQLNPCPFCGDHEIVHTIWGDGNWSRIACEGCGVEMDYFNSEKEAFDWWNTRAQPSDGALTNEGAEPVAYIVEVDGMTLHSRVPSPLPRATNTPLYRRLPAQASVVLPERKQVPGNGVWHYLQPDYLGWNEYDDELKRLNPTL